MRAIFKSRTLGSIGLLAVLVAALLLMGSCAKKEEAAPATNSQSAEQTSSAPADGATATEEPVSRPTPAGGESTTETAPAVETPTAGAAPATITRPAQPEPARVPPRDPNVFIVRFETTKGDIDIECHSDWAPIGAARFRELVESGYYDGARFFRVVPNFVVQFGLAANPLLTAKWDNSNLRDDPVQQSNRRGYMTFATAGPNTRTTQIFINLADNARLDGMGFAPFARVIRGMDAVDSIDSRYGEQPQQPRIEDEGETYLSQNFPNLDKIVKARVLP
ncbi:MAG: peptidylprolyl isomerase [Bryobacterales bacterium]|jgi:cyclophilin family peptidyl-prolyl cis-trans isomerase|nr:peptidylprolyl isomerase [Bryobacterales bacterium]